MHGLAITAHHVGDLDHHLRAVRAANAELRDRIESVRLQLAEAERGRVRRMEIEATIGARVLAVELELEEARADAREHLAGISAAAEEAVRAIVARGRDDAEQLRQAVEEAVGGDEPAAVVPLTPRAVVSLVDRACGSADERSAVM